MRMRKRYWFNPGYSRFTRQALLSQAAGYAEGDVLCINLSTLGILQSVYRTDTPLEAQYNSSNTQTSFINISGRISLYPFNKI